MICISNDFKIYSVLKHPNTVGMLGITVNPLRIVIEFIKGGDLNKLLRSEKPGERVQLTLEQKYRIAYDIALGMNYLQSFTPPIVHRDLRSPNIFVSFSKSYNFYQYIYISNSLSD